MADSYNKKEREKKRRKRKQNKAEKKKQKKEDGNTPLEFMYMDENGNLSASPPDPNKKEVINAEDIEVGIAKSEGQDQNKFRKDGFVKFFNAEKGYGFIQEAVSNTDYFTHVDNLIDPIQENDKVLFEIGSGPKGPMAINVQLLKND
jgi:cold shock CspA family protein